MQITLHSHPGLGREGCGGETFLRYVQDLGFHHWRTPNQNCSASASYCWGSPMPNPLRQSSAKVYALPATRKDATSHSNFGLQKETKLFFPNSRRNWWR